MVATQVRCTYTLPATCNAASACVTTRSSRGRLLLGFQCYRQSNTLSICSCMATLPCCSPPPPPPPSPHPHHHLLLHRQLSKQQQQHSSSRRTMAARLRCARSTPPPCSALQRWSSGELLGLGNCNSFLCKQREGLVCVSAGPTSCRIIQQAVATASGSSCCRR